MNREILIAAIVGILSAAGATVLTTARQEERINALEHGLETARNSAVQQIQANSQTIADLRERLARVEQCK